MDETGFNTGGQNVSSSGSGAQKLKEPEVDPKKDLIPTSSEKSPQQELALGSKDLLDGKAMIWKSSTNMCLYH